VTHSSGPTPTRFRVRLEHERQQLAEEEQEHLAPDALDYESDIGILPNVEALGPVEAYDAGIEAGIELATDRRAARDLRHRRVLRPQRLRLTPVRIGGPIPGNPLNHGDDSNARDQ